MFRQTDLTAKIKKPVISLVSIFTLLSLFACSGNLPPIRDTQNEQAITAAKLIPNFNADTRISNFKFKTKALKLDKIGTNASGITWDPFIEQYFVIQNNSAVIYRYDRHFEFLGRLKKVGNINNDTEGLTYIDGTRIAIVTEANTAHQIEFNQQVFEQKRYHSSLDYRFDGRPKHKNKGFEGIAFRPGNIDRPARIYAGQEGSGRYADAKMRVVYFDANSQPSFGSRLLSYQDEDFNLIEPFNAEQKFAGIITDIAGMTFDPLGNTLIIVSQESRKAIQVDPSTGDVLDQLSLSGAPAYEGVTIGPNGELVFVSEKKWVQIYSQSDLSK